MGNRVCTKRTWTQGRLGVRGGDQLWQGVKWDPSHHSSTIKCRPGVRLVSRAASRLTWATNKANDPSSPTILTWPTLVPPVVWERGPCEPSVFVLWLVDSACWSGGTFFSSLERCLVSGAKGAIVKPRDQAQRWQWDYRPKLVCNNICILIEIGNLCLFSSSLFTTSMYCCVTSGINMEE